MALDFKKLLIALTPAVLLVVLIAALLVFLPGQGPESFECLDIACFNERSAECLPTVLNLNYDLQNPPARPFLNQGAGTGISTMVSLEPKGEECLATYSVIYPDGSVPYTKKCVLPKDAENKLSPLLANLSGVECTEERRPEQ